MFYRWRIWLKWPRVWIVVDGIAKFLPVLALFVSVVRGGMVKIGCHSDSQAVEGDYWLAQLQNWLMFFGSWTSSFGYAIVASNVLLLTLRPLWLNKALPWINAFDITTMWIFPLVIMIVMTSLEYTG